MTTASEDWILPKDSCPTRNDGPMANANKVQVNVRTPTGAIERRNYYVAAGSSGRVDSFDDSDIRPVAAWQPLPLDAEVEPYFHEKNRRLSFWK